MKNDWIFVDRTAYIVRPALDQFTSFIMQSPTTADAPPVKRKYNKKKDKADVKQKKTKWETDSAFIPDPTKEKPEPEVIEKSYVMTKEGQWVEEKEKQDEAIQALLEEVNQIPQNPSPPRAPMVDLLTCPFHSSPLTRKKPPDEIEKQEILFCPDVDCPVFLFANDLETYLQALHYTAPSLDVMECWDMLQCFCHFTPILKLSHSTQNPNRLFLSCNNFNKELRCPYFQWFDEEFSMKITAWQDELRFEFKQLPVPKNREEAKRKAQEHKELCKKMAHKQYFTNLKKTMEEKRKHLANSGGWGVPRGDGARDNGGGESGGSGGGGGAQKEKKSPFLYYTRPTVNWNPYVSQDGSGTVLF